VEVENEKSSASSIFVQNDKEEDHNMDIDMNITLLNASSNVISLFDDLSCKCDGTRLQTQTKKLDSNLWRNALLLFQYGVSNNSADRLVLCIWGKIFQH